MLFLVFHAVMIPATMVGVARFVDGGVKAFATTKSVVGKPVKKIIG
jgi:hypothetical protein